ncbi:hypothetical protein [Bifidobacterium cuniculi]|uniref:Dihydroneopterin aldolase n=1 Tax=Bifidobacterium cuniculi TaxID=1688 RepID=A0A087AKL3_9BIFI|nr:hypothetical protein [Bifidobacterium cuniculi]KFI59313.1 Dihydroneopterin aldolase [Bifidobacterium cuniculi]
MTSHTLSFTGVDIPNTTWHVEVTCTGEDPIDSALAAQVVRQVLATMRDATAERIAADLAEEVALRVPCGHVEVVVDFAVDDMPGRYAVATDRDTVGEALPVEHVSRGAVIAMESAVPNAEDVMRAAIVAIDGIPGTQVEGISPLYHVTAPDGRASHSAVIALHTTMSLRQLNNMLQALHGTHEGAVGLGVVAMDGLQSRERAGLDLQGAKRAAFLAPWMDMDPDATVDGDPVAFALANAPDAPFVGLASDHWIIGGGH